MNNHFDMSYLGVMVDMAGCPNRCRHCWLGSRRNGNMSVEKFKDIAAQFKSWRDEGRSGIAELSFFTWWREPDYRDDYRELWELENELSSPGRAMRFELLSTWRLTRDAGYAKWAANLPSQLHGREASAVGNQPKKCQISFFGLEENTDWGMRRKGAFRDQLIATKQCLTAGIAPRWQLFLTKRCLGELDEFYRLIFELELHKRCEAIGGKFEFFFGGISPEGSGYELEDERIEKSDLSRIPLKLASLSRDGLDMIGQPEDELMESLLNIHKPERLSANYLCIAVDADYDAYPNIAEPAPWWRLGNIKSDGVDKVIRAYRDGTTPGMRANDNIPVSELARRYGSAGSKKLYSKNDLITRYLHQWGAEQY